MHTTETAYLPVKPRTFLPKDLTLSGWDTLQAFYADLEERQIGSAEDLEKWMEDRSELQSVVQEDLGWRYIRMSCDTGNKPTEPETAQLSLPRSARQG
jgi:oligoendopeptidase F